MSNDLEVVLTKVFKVFNNLVKYMTSTNPLNQNIVSIILLHFSYQNSINPLAYINDIINVSDKPMDTQRQYRSKFIGQVNQYILLEYGIEEGIERSTSASDKRFVYYKASSNLLKKLKGI